MREVIFGVVILAAMLLAVDAIAWPALRRAFGLRSGSRTKRTAAVLFWARRRWYLPC